MFLHDFIIKRYDNYYTVTMLFNDGTDPNFNQVELVDNGLTFPSEWVVHKKLAANKYGRLTLTYDTHWRVHEIIHTTLFYGEKRLPQLEEGHPRLTAADMYYPNIIRQVYASQDQQSLADIVHRGISIEIRSLRYYDPIFNEFIIMDKVDGVLYQNTARTANLSFIDDHWDFTRINVYVQTQRINVIYPFIHIDPDKCEEFDSLQIHIYKIRVVHSDNLNAKLNGIYVKAPWNEQWESNNEYVFNNSAKIEGLTVYRKIDESRKYGKIIHELSHNNTDNVHKWKLRSIQFVQRYQSADPYNIAATIDTARWKKLDFANDKMEICENCWAKTVREEFYQAPNVQRVILNYKHKWEVNMNTVLCSPYALIQDEQIFFKIIAPSGKVDHIIASVYGPELEETRCIPQNADGTGNAYLMVKDLTIEADIFDGKVIAFVDLFFSDIDGCEKWRDRFVKNRKRIAGAPGPGMTKARIAKDFGDAWQEKGKRWYEWMASFVPSRFRGT